MITVTNNSPQAINTSLFSLEKEIQEMLKRVERIKGDLDGLDVGVVSVNDKTGKVELTAEDVGALPSDTHIPADQVQSNWTETDTTKPDYIKNKPTVPTKTSQLTNDSDFATNSGVLSDIASALSGGQTYGINITGNASTAQKLSIALSFNSGGSTVYKKISGLVVPNQENVFLLQSRAGELLLISVGHGDGMKLATPKVKRLLDVYSKIQGLSILNSDVIVKIASYSHACYLTQIAGSTISEIVISDSTQSEYDSGTPITIET